MNDTSHTIISIRNLKKTFKDNQVLDGVNLEIPEKKITSILGTSGVGKSVLIKCIIHILKADSGEIWYKGENILHTHRSTKTHQMSDFAYLFQESALFDSLSVKENIAFPIREVLKIRDKHFIDRRVKELLDWINLSGIESLMPSHLSGGMKKRVGFARTLAMEPKILLCDEPTTGLDPVTGKMIMNLIVKANREFGITCIIITHDLPASIRVSDHIAFLDRGRIRYEGSSTGFLNSDYELLIQFIENSYFEKYLKK